jgi:hypothetical protein
MGLITSTTTGARPVRPLFINATISASYTTCACAGAAFGAARAKVAKGARRSGSPLPFHFPLNSRDEPSGIRVGARRASFAQVCRMFAVRQNDGCHAEADGRGQRQAKQDRPHVTLRYRGHPVGRPSQSRACHALSC